MIEACGRNDKAFVEVLLNKNADVNLQGDYHDVAPLHKAVRPYDRRPNHDIVKMLIDKKADVNLEDCNGTMPLHIPCFYGHKVIAKTLIDKGADVNGNSKTHGTPLNAACRHGHKGIVEMLIAQNADVNKQDTCGYTPLLNTLDRLRMLSTNKQDHSDDKALKRLREENTRDIGALLLENGADVNISSYDRYSPNRWPYTRKLDECRLRFKTKLRFIIKNLKEAVRDRDLCKMIGHYLYLSSDDKGTVSSDDKDTVFLQSSAINDIVDVAFKSESTESTVKINPLASQCNSSNYQDKNRSGASDWKIVFKS